MVKGNAAIAKPRAPLSRERVLRAAIALADKGGIAALSMRLLAREVGVEAMSLYNHVADKGDLVDGMVDLVFGEIATPFVGADWKAEMRLRADSAREVLARHPWASSLMQSRLTPGPATLRHHDSVIGSFRTAGFTVAMTAHAFSLIDSYIYGFAQQQQNLTHSTSEEAKVVAENILERTPADDYPHLAEMISGYALRPGYDYADEFTFGLDLILDGLERLTSAPKR